jgi:hypothetical protein
MGSTQSESLTGYRLPGQRLFVVFLCSWNRFINYTKNNTKFEVLTVNKCSDMFSDDEPHRCEVTVRYFSDVSASTSIYCDFRRHCLLRINQSLSCTITPSCLFLISFFTFFCLRPHWHKVCVSVLRAAKLLKQNSLGASEFVASIT